MRTLSRLGAALGYTFSAWIAAALIVNAGSKLSPRPLQIAFHCGAVLAAFWPVFGLYFRREDSLPPAGAAALAVGFIVGLDLVLIGPYFLHAVDCFRSFWDWQLPAALMTAAIYGAGRLERGPRRRRKDKTFSPAS